jgi:hypothetical protein
MTLDYFNLEIGHGTGRVSIFFGFAILQHNHAVFVVGIGQGKGFG